MRAPGATTAGVGDPISGVPKQVQSATGWGFLDGFLTGINNTIWPNQPGAVINYSTDEATKLDQNKTVDKIASAAGNASVQVGQGVVRAASFLPLIIIVVVFTAIVTVIKR